MAYWLMKSEPSEVSIDDLESRPNRIVPWFGVRNYQARNFMKNEMNVGDQAYFYHSNCPIPGIAGVVEICSSAYPDASQFDANSKYFDPKSTIELPRWFNVDVRFIKKTGLISLSELRQNQALQSMQILSKGNRLSITHLTEQEWHVIESMLTCLMLHHQ
jgi:predicted RNA-binding protein with PUA-like domain